MKRIFTIIGALGVLMMLESCARIDAGHVGLKVSMYGTDKGVNDITEVTGRVVYNPFTTDIVEFPTFSQTKDYQPFTITAKGGSQFTVDPVITYYVSSDKAPHIFRQYRKPLNELENGILKNMVYDSYRITMARYSPDSLINNREKFESEVDSALMQSFREEGFIYQKTTANIIPPQSLQDAINAKNLAVQQSLQTKNLVEKEKAQAEIAIAKAKGEAEAKRIEADGIYYYNERVQQSLSQQLLQQQWISKWNGTMPTVTSGNSGGIILQMPTK
jgi:regulator of protease activity HflC (stomatin/prohibitin superfamily)